MLTTLKQMKNRLIVDVVCAIEQHVQRVSRQCYGKRMMAGI